MAELYSKFRKNPHVEHLSPDATCSYLSSGVYLNSPEKTVEHFHQQIYEVELVKEEVIKTHETPTSLVLETETQIKFLRGPGAFLPGMSINFVADEEATIYLLHIIEFDPDTGRISKIRLTWDQATLLKQLSVIGSRGNAWPIYSGNDQVLLARNIPAVTTRLLRDERATTDHSPIRGWQPSSIPGLTNQNQMDKVPTPVPAMAPPSPSAKPPNRSFQDIVDLANTKQPDYTPRRGRRVDRPQSAYMNLFGAEESQEYKRVIGAGPRNERQRNNATPQWAAWLDNSNIE